MKTQPKEVDLRHFWDLDIILEYQPDFNRIVIKKPSGQVFVDVKPRDKRK